MSHDSKTLLLLDSNEVVQEIIQSMVLDHDLSMHTAQSVEDAFRLLAKGHVFAFTFNLQLISSDPVEFVRKLRRDYPDMTLMVLLDDKRKDLMIDLLQAGTFACITLPLQAGVLTYNLGKIIANNSETYNPFSIKYEERKLIIPNDFSLVMQVSKNLVDSTLPKNEKNRYHIILGLSEIINNAIEHGNLGITFEEKSDALKASRFYPLALERALKEPYKDRVVTIESRVYPNKNRIEYFVSDEGAGFDWRILPDPKEKENLLNRNGRGIMMARYAFDELTYNEIGNQVTMVINLDLPLRTRRS